MIQISNVTFYHNGFSTFSNDSSNAIGRFRIQFILRSEQWHTEFVLEKNSVFCNT